MKLDNALELMNKCAVDTGADQFDIIAGESNDTSVSVFRSKVKETEISSSQGIGIRLFRDKKPGYSYTRSLTEDAIRRCVADAFDLSQYSAEVDFELPEQPDIEQVDMEVWNEDLQNLTTPELLDLSFSLEKHAGEADALVENVLSAGVGKSSSRFLLLNSKGMNWNSRRNSTMAGVSLVAAKGEIKKSGGKYKGTRFFNEFDPEAMATRAAEKAISMLDAKPIKAGACPVLFDNWMSPGIIRPFMSAIYAETVQKGQSKLEGKVGEIIASDCLTITNDPFVPGMPGSGQIDSEGTPSSKFDVIKNGRLMTFLYNLQSAQKAGVAPTGNGKRSYAGKAGTGFDNLFVTKGNRSRQDILSSLDRCLMVTKFEGSGIRSAVSGEISLGVQGFLYEKGELIQAVDRVTISGNYYTLLKNITEFSNEYSDSFSSTKIPDMLISEMNVSC